MLGLSAGWLVLIAAGGLRGRAASALISAIFLAHAGIMA